MLRVTGSWEQTWQTLSYNRSCNIARGPIQSLSACASIEDKAALFAAGATRGQLECDFSFWRVFCCRGCGCLLCVALCLRSVPCTCLRHVPRHAFRTRSSHCGRQALRGADWMTQLAYQQCVYKKHSTGACSPLCPLLSWVSLAFVCLWTNRLQAGPPGSSFY